MKRLPGVFARGVAMGAADVVPGVSGGTVALITGIYEELIDTLAGIRPHLLGVLWRQGLMAFWRAGNFGFLVTLLAGDVSAIILLAGLIKWLLANQPVPIWSFFTGLILTSIWLVMRPVKRWHWDTGLMLVLGLLVGAWISHHPAVSGVHTTPLVFFLSGAVAICAMILPGISGSFILVLLGMYEPVLDAVHGGQYLPVLAFVAGCASGLLAFVQLLRWLLHHWHDAILAMLAGFMGGSLIKLWPWHVIDHTTLVQANLLPGEWAQRTGEPAQLWMALVAALVGVLVVWLLSRAADRHNGANDRKA